MHKQLKKNTFGKAFKKAVMTFVHILPMLLAVVALVGIMQTYVTPDMLASLFGYGSLSDTLAGTFAGAVAVGQGIISYVIGEGLVAQGVSLYAVGAFVLAWVTLGLIQLPAESAIFGLKFTLYRNLLALLSTITIVYLTVTITGWLSL